MSRPIVVDASVAFPLLHDGPDSEAVSASVRDWRALRRRLVVPAHFWLEILNALGRGRGYRSAELLESLRELDELRLETMTMGRPVHVLVADLIERHALTSYDAAYLAVAETIDGELATLDRQLGAAAGWRWLDPRARGAPGQLSEERAPYGTDGSISWPRWSGAGAYLAELRARALAGETS